MEKHEEPFWERCARGTKHDTQIEQLERRMDKVEEAVIDIRDHLLRRPSWSVSIIITLLTTICASLSLFIITKL